MTYTQQIVNGRLVFVNLDRDGKPIPPQPAPPPGGGGLDYPPGLGPGVGLVQGMTDGSEVVRPLALLNNPQGLTDDAQIINDSLARCGVTRLIPFQQGFYSIQSPIIIPNSYCSLLGVGGYGFQSTIQSAATSAMPQMVIAGQTAILQQVTIRDIAFKGNANTGHGIVFRSNNGLLDNVIVQGQGLTGDCFHLALDALSGTVFDVTARNCSAFQPGATGTGFLLDANYNSCELELCRTQGGTGAGALAAAWGFQLLGSECKLLLCHADLFLNGGGALLSGVGRHQAIGGEYETNAGPGIKINGAPDCKIVGTSHYGNTGTQDIAVTSGAQYCSIVGTTHESPGVASAITLDGTVSHIGITSARSKIGKSINAAAGSNFLLASLNDFAGTAITHSGANDIVVNNL